MPIYNIVQNCDPTDLEITAYASSTHYYFEQYYNDKPAYYGTLSNGDSRYLYWTGSYWMIAPSLPSGGYFATCSEEIIHKCSSGIYVEYCVVANQSDGDYYVNGEYNGQWIFQSADNDRYIYYDSDNLWKISSQVQGSDIYATCNKTNIFECSESSSIPSTFDINSCVTKSPTSEPTLTPITTIDPPGESLLGKNT